MWSYIFNDKFEHLLYTNWQENELQIPSQAWMIRSQYQNDSYDVKRMLNIRTVKLLVQNTLYYLFDIKCLMYGRREYNW